MGAAGRFASDRAWFARPRWSSRRGMSRKRFPVRVCCTAVRSARTNACHTQGPKNAGMLCRVGLGVPNSASRRELDCLRRFPKPRRQCSRPACRPPYAAPVKTASRNIHTPGLGRSSNGVPSVCYKKVRLTEIFQIVVPPIQRSTEWLVCTGL